MNYHESETIEFKEIVTDNVKKEIVAFANCDGGKLYIGINDRGEIIGVENPDAVIQQISSMVRDAIIPDVTMFIHYETVAENDKRVVLVTVQRGTDRPYYLAGKGLRPSGVYVRQGTSSVPSTDTAIRQMIKDTDGDSFEEMRSLEQDLTFQATAREFEQRGIAFAPAQMKTLKILNTDDIYTNLGLLLSEQCTHVTKTAVFEGKDQNIFKDRREFSGSLLQQLTDVYDYIDMRNQIHATFDKLRRIDNRDYPEVAIREALLNSLVHRDYSFHASTLISIYVDRIEFVSIGGLLPGITLDDIMLGLSVCRNPGLANVFYRLELIEAYGTGIQKIMNAYTGTGKTPLIKATDNAFKITLPNLNVKDLHVTAPIVMQSPCIYNAPNNREDKILSLVYQNGSIARQDVETLFDTAQTTAGRMLKQMCEKNLLVQVGNGKNTRYRLPY